MSAIRKVYVGNLPTSVRTKDLERIFDKFGRIEHIELKTGRGTPFAFIEFEDNKDAEDAVHARDNYNFDGYALRVELSRGGRNARENSYGSGGRGGRDSYDNSNGGKNGYYTRGNRFGPPSRRSEFRVRITGLPPSGSWQDLKDHMREAGDVGYADVYKDGSGVVEFLRADDMKYALRKLDDTKFKSHEGEVTYIRVRQEKPSARSRSRTRSRSRGRSYERGRCSPTYSSMGSRSGSRSRSRSRSSRD